MDAPGGHARNHDMLLDQASCANVRSFCITDLETYLNGSEFPIIDIIYHATNSKAATCVLGGLLILLLFFSTVTTVASASRQVWAFSRDRGFPFSSWICHVRPAWEIPANAVSADPLLPEFAATILTTFCSWSSASQSLSCCLPSILAPTPLSKLSSRCPTRL